MIHEEDDGLWVELTESIACHPEEVFACLTTDWGLTRWLPVSASVDLRPGGLIVLGWDAAKTRKTTIAILDYDPGGTITWDWLCAYDDTHAPVYWTVTPEVEEGARVTLRQGPFKPTHEGMIAMAEEAFTWQWHLCNLRCVLEARHDMRRVRPI